MSMLTRHLFLLGVRKRTVWKHRREANGGEVATEFPFSADKGLPGNQSKSAATDHTKGNHSHLCDPNETFANKPKWSVSKRVAADSEAIDCLKSGFRNAPS